MKFLDVTRLPLKRNLTPIFSEQKRMQVKKMVRMEYELTRSVPFIGTS
jgi:hypothetical protein